MNLKKKQEKESLNMNFNHFKNAQRLTKLLSFISTKRNLYPCNWYFKFLNTCSSTTDIFQRHEMLIEKDTCHLHLSVSIHEIRHGQLQYANQPL